MRAPYLLIAFVLVLAGMMSVLAEPAVTIYTDNASYQPGDTIQATVDVTNPGNAATIDLCVGLLAPDGGIYTIGPDGWLFGIVPWCKEMRIPGGFDMTAHFYFGVPSALPLPPIGQEGTYYFACLCLEPGTWNWASNLSLASLSYTSGGTSTEIEMHSIPGGSFLMGSPSEESGRDADEGPQRTVQVSAFSISETEITEKQWEDVMGWKDCLSPKGDFYPVENVTWFDCLSFCNELSRADGYAECYTITNVQLNGMHIASADVDCDFDANGYRLPTGAEWEYACRAGTVTRFYTGDLESDLDLAGWFYSNSSMEKHAVAEKTSNSLGLFDMHGNVLEWCWDRYDGGYYQSRPDPDTDPTGPDEGATRVVRGGGLGNPAEDCRSANRYGNSPGGKYADVGLRVVRSAD
ncbi:MAG: formylglycine-generating enzyme family protein [Candidatus Coatesbacteria bacterium]|nr:formylglycine-generating enzyme family protein [Candidatus Coatesbacteria bacterium]